MFAAFRHKLAATKKLYLRSVNHNLLMLTLGRLNEYNTFIIFYALSYKSKPTPNPVLSELKLYSLLPSGGKATGNPLG